MGQRTVGKQRSVLRHAPRHRALAPRREPCPAGSCGSLRPRPGREGSAVARAAAAVVDLSSGFVADVQVAVVGGLAKCLASPRGTAPLRISRRPPVRPRRARPSCLWGCPAVCVCGRLPLPSVRRSCGPRTCGHRHAWASRRRGRSSCRWGRSCFWAGGACLPLAFCFFC